MTNFVIKMHNMYYSREALRPRVVFNHKLTDATFFDNAEAARKEVQEQNLVGFCKIMQVTYVEHDIGFVEHNLLVKA